MSSVEEQRAELARHLTLAHQLAPQSLEHHALAIHRDSMGRRIVPRAHHSEWVRVLEDRKNFPWVVVVAPPGYAKSTWFCSVYPTWRIGQTGGRVRIGLLSNTATQARGWAGTVQQACTSQAFKRCYPGIIPNTKRGWRNDVLYFNGTPAGPNPSLLATGIGGPVQGKRFDEIILDDPTNWDEAQSEAVMDGQRRFVKTTLLKRFPAGMGPPAGDGGRMVVVLTRWSERDLVPVFEDLGFKVIRMPALGYWDRVVTCKRCSRTRRTELELCECGEWAVDVEYGDTALWPEAETREQLIQEREDDELIFELVKQGDPKVMSGSMFQLEWFRRGPLPKRGEFEQVIQFVDTAGGKDRKHGDFFVDATVGTIDGKIWVMDVDRGRYSAPEQQERIVVNAGKWNPVKVIIEDKNEGNAIYQQLVRDTRLPLDTSTPTKGKEFRAIPLANRYKLGDVWHPEGERFVPYLEMELRSFPGGRNDDQVDAVGGAYNKLTAAGIRIRYL